MQPGHAAALELAIFRTRSGDTTGNTGGEFEECKVHHVDATGLYFTRPMFDNNVSLWGPAPYTWPAVGVTGATAVSTFGTHTHSEPTPSNGPDAGDRVLIAWVAASIDGLRPWAIGWDAT
jgi:hypothetical protein